MRCGGVRRAISAPRGLSRLLGVFAAALLAAAAAGCSSQTMTRFTPVNTGGNPGATIAFESIDGPPPDVFRKLVLTLNDEAAKRQVAVVSRSGPAAYRVRGYVSALVERDRTSFAWVWDIYDAGKRRTLRIGGEEPATAAPGNRDSWAAADERVLRSIARTGMERVAAFLDTPSQTPADPDRGPSTLVASRDGSPDAAGSFRTSGAPDQANEPAAQPNADMPDPPPQPTKTRGGTAAAHPVTRSAALEPRP